MLRFTVNNTTLGQGVFTKDPLDWKELKPKLERHPKFHGVFKQFTQTLGFICNGGGKEYIDLAWETFGAEAEVTILIEWDDCNPGTFETLFDGKLDFRTYKRGNESNLAVTRVNAVKNDITTKIINRAGVKVDLDASTSAEGDSLGASYTYGNYDLELHSKGIFLESELQDPNSATVLTGSIVGIVAAISREIAANTPLPVSKNEIQETVQVAGVFNIPSPAIGINRETFRGTSGTSFHDTNLQPLPKVVPGDYDISWDMDGDYTDEVTLGSITRQSIGSPFAGLDFSFYVGADLATATKYTLGSIAAYGPTAAAVYTTTFSVTGSQTVTVADGDQIWLGWGYGWEATAVGAGANNVQFTFSYDAGSYFLMELLSTTPVSDCKAFAIYEAFARVSGWCADKSNAFASNFFGRKNSSPNTYAANGCGSFTAVTNGLSIRGLNNDSYDYPVTMSLNDLFDSQNAIWDIGLTVNSDDKVQVERKDYFYDSSTVIFQALEVYALEMTVGLEYIYNQLKAGYTVWTTEDFNGLDDIHGSQEYSLPSRAVKREYDALCKFIASGYAIERTRRLGQNAEITTDWKYDNNSFVICLKRGVDGGGNPDELAETEVDENYSAVSGMLDSASAYNLRITPKRNILRNIATANGGFTKDPGGLFRFQSGEANLNLSSTMTADSCEGDFTGAALDEDANLAWDNSNIREHDPLWLPEIYSFTYKITKAQWDAILANPNGVVEFAQGTTATKKGFILTAEYDPYNATVEFKLLRANV